MSNSFENSRSGEILAAAQARQPLVPREKPPLEARARAVLALKADIINKCGPEGLQVFEHLNITLSLLDPELMVENRPLYKRMEAAFIRDLRDLREGKIPPQ